MVSPLYDALKGAGVDEEKARKAAEVVANCEYRLAAIEARLNAITGRVTDLAEKVKEFNRRINLLIWLIWIVGFIIGANLAILVLRPH
jgi:beta-lactamase regulating signal transducer with metallopeptidase domain